MADENQAGIKNGGMPIYDCLDTYRHQAEKPLPETELGKSSAYLPPKL